jgi:hypothetical protein
MQKQNTKDVEGRREKLSIELKKDRSKGEERKRKQKMDKGREHNKEVNAEKEMM